MRRHLLELCWVVPLLATPLVAQSTSDDSAFVAWARTALHPLDSVDPDAPFDDLAALDAVIGDSRIIAIAESPHAGAEPLLLRNRLARYLVEKHGFSAIAIESGFVEGRAVHDYVQGGAGDIEDVVQRGITWGFHEFPQNISLVRWMREHNSASGATVVDYYGFDLSGATRSFAGGAPRMSGSRAALEYLLTYLERVDPPAHAVFSHRLEGFLPRVARFGEGAYSELDAAERDELTAVIAELASTLALREAGYREGGTDDEFSWALQVAEDARLSDILLRNENDDVIDPAHEDQGARELAQAKHVGWIVEQTGTSGRVMIFASNPHLTGVPVLMQSPREFLPPEVPAEPRPWVPAGAFLRGWYEDDYTVLGNLVGGTQQIGCNDFAMSTAPPPAATVAGLLRRAGAPLFVLDLGDAPPRVGRWLDEPRQFDRNPPFLIGPPRDAFDAIIYMDSVTPSCPRDVDADHVEIQLDRSIIERYVGVYELSPETRVRVTMEYGGLAIWMPGAGAVMVYPEAETRFFAKLFDAQVRFVLEDGNVSALVFTRGGNEQTGRRIEEGGP